MSLALTYARALHETLPAGDASGARRELLSVVDAVSSSRELRMALYGPIATPAEKEKILRALGQKLSLSPVTLLFLTLMAKKNRLVALPEVADAFDRVTVESAGGALGEISSAEALPDDVVSGFERSFGSKVGKKVELRQKQDPALLAGVRVTLDGVTYDGSLRVNLDRLKERMLGAEKAWN